MPLQAPNVADCMPVYGEQQVAALYARLLARAVRIDALGLQVAAIFDPPNAIGRTGEAAALLEIDRCEDDRSHAD